MKLMNLKSFETTATMHHYYDYHHRTVIDKPEDRDVLLGRNSTSWNHPGNSVFRGVILKHHREYKALGSRSEKSKVIRKILQEVKSTGARFLERCGDEDGDIGWLEVDDYVVRSKIGSALRDKQREKRSGGSAGTSSLTPPGSPFAARRTKSSLQRPSKMPKWPTEEETTTADGVRNLAAVPDFPLLGVMTLPLEPTPISSLPSQLMLRPMAREEEQAETTVTETITSATLEPKNTHSDHNHHKETGSSLIPSLQQEPSAGAGTFSLVDVMAAEAKKLSLQQNQDEDSTDATLSSLDKALSIIHSCDDDDNATDQDIDLLNELSFRTLSMLCDEI